MRPSIIVTVADAPAGEGNVLVDTTPEMRIQMLRAGIPRVEAVFLTHHHADHIMGMDDIRQFNFRTGRSMPIYSDVSTLDHVRTVFSYAFRETPAGGGKPKLDLHELAAREMVEVCGVSVTPLPILHGALPISAYKFGARFAYVTDASQIPASTREELRGLDTLILGAVQHEKHSTHFSVGEAVEVIRDLAPRQAYLTHLSHHIDYARDRGALPDNVALAYDGLRFAVPGVAAVLASA